MECAPYKIVFVEDDKVDQMAFERFARREHFPYEYIIAGSVEQTRQLLRTTPVDAAVVDYVLGDGVAFDLFDDLAGIPIILVTGIGNEEIAVKAMKAGAYDYLIKDQEGNYLKTLALTVENAIQRKQNELELQKHRERLEELVAQRTQELKNEIYERTRVQEELQASLKEKEVLLRELHHRVKNNLQVISSLLDLQSEDIKDPLARDIFLEAQNRIRSIAHIHEQLYQSSNLAELDVHAYITQLAHTLLQSYGKTGISLGINVTVVSLDVDTAVSCGLIINELMSNSLKYAFPQKSQPLQPPNEIQIALQTHDTAMLLLEVKDNGIGFPHILSEEHQALSFGLRLVKMLVRQLKGEITIDSTHGTKVAIIFERSAYPPRSVKRTTVSTAS